MPTPRPCLWFDGRDRSFGAEMAAEQYVKIFPNSSVDTIGPMTVEFTLDGQRFLGLNGGPEHPFTDAVSFEIPCADQAEVDHYWDALVDGGEPGRCGWLTDRFGLSWQVVPVALPSLLGDPDPERSGRAMQAMLGMSKLVIAELEAAADGAT